MKLATLSTADVRANSLQKQNEYLQVVFKKFERENANLKADVSSKNDQLELDKFQIFQITGPNPWVIHQFGSGTKRYSSDGARAQTE